jgi:hypothetical protein
MLDELRVGVVGEVEFEERFSRFGFKVDESPRPEGDTGVDFTHPAVGTIDVKTARKPVFLFVKEKDIDRVADVLVLARYEDGAVTFLGWERGSAMKDCPKRQFIENGPVNFHKRAEDLRNMVTLIAALEGWKIEGREPGEE